MKEENETGIWMPIGYLEAVNQASSSTLRVLTAILRRMWETKKPYAVLSQNEIAEMTGMKQQNVKRTIDEEWIETRETPEGTAFRPKQEKFPHIKRWMSLSEVNQNDVSRLLLPPSKVCDSLAPTPLKSMSPACSYPPQKYVSRSVDPTSKVCPSVAPPPRETSDHVVRTSTDSESPSTVPPEEYSVPEDLDSKDLRSIIIRPSYKDQASVSDSDSSPEESDSPGFSTLVVPVVLRPLVEKILKVANFNDPGPSTIETAKALSKAGVDVERFDALVESLRKHNAPARIFPKHIRDHLPIFLAERKEIEDSEKYHAMMRRRASKIIEESKARCARGPSLAAIANISIREAEKADQALLDTALASERKFEDQRDRLLRLGADPFEVDAILHGGPLPPEEWSLTIQRFTRLWLESLPPEENPNARSGEITPPEPGS